jgi:HAD domain in Swiss Army Knife RNA repair proteins
MRTRVFLDVDGVLNPETKRPPGPFTDWRISNLDGVTITWSPTVAHFIGQLAYRAEVLWLTTWADAAQIHLEPLMGLPRLELAGSCDPDTPWRWWKHDVVTALWETDLRSFVWIDDDLPLFTEALDWLKGLPVGQALAIAPDPGAGLAPEHLDMIDRFVALHADPA